MTFNPRESGTLKKAVAFALEYLDSLTPKLGAIAVVAMILPQNLLPAYVSIPILALSILLKSTSCILISKVNDKSE